jgi:hypothetical protein
MPSPLILVRRASGAALLLLLLLLSMPGAVQAQVPEGCARVLHADVVAFDQPFFWNRLGAAQPQGMIYALRRDVCGEVCQGGACWDACNVNTLTPGRVWLRSDKRPRPIVLRMNVGDCLRIDFQNLLAPVRREDEQPATRWASIHAIGMELQTIADDGSFVGENASSSQVDVGQSITYFLAAPDREGEHVLFSTGATNGGEGDGGSTNAGLFGALNVEPVGARWFRSQVTQQDLAQATTGTSDFGQPILDYEARYPVGHRQAGTPVLDMLDGTEIVHTDLTALITGSEPNPNITTGLEILAESGSTQPGWFPPATFPPNFYTYPEREQPFREFTILYHDEIGAVQAFADFEQPALKHTLESGRDAFAINYGAAGIGAEVLANRLSVGPQWRCTECKFEEFFLSSWSVGDPAMVVDVPANAPCGEPRPGVPCAPEAGAKATKAFYPDDPSNVYHSYLRDHVRFRVLHAGTKEHHIHHLHAHQWLFTADSDKSSYLDSQAIGPGNSFTAEIAHEGGGNLNLTPGDSIFHCHFYPHFADGMWSLWRVHDVFESGTPLDGNGRPAAGSRALPDGEIAAGTPIPAVVPLPEKPMAPLPEVSVQIVNGQAVIGSGGNPGYPFFVPGLAGHRPPHPPLDTIDDGGLPRHRIDGGTFTEAHTRLDFHKTLERAIVTGIPENGTPVEQAAMTYHAMREHQSCLPNGVCDQLFACGPCDGPPWSCECPPPPPHPVVKFITNGLPPVAGAPFADPCEDVYGNPVGNPRLYKAADIQDDVKLNKKGWHFPQQRFLSLWQDVNAYLFPAAGQLKKPPEPLFFRANTDDCIQYQLTNLVPNETQLDDFQVRTPTDVIGQHIHLVKFDVTASDGAANGFNYEDGSFSPDEVRERIAAIRLQYNCTENDPRNGSLPCPVARAHPFFGAGPNGRWIGAQTTVQRWLADPVQDNQGNDRTLRTVFTHDHMSPSTHQQAGLYAGLVIEPQGSTWIHNETGVPFYTRPDGGPTSWQAVITTPSEDYREFLLEFGDFQLGYEETANHIPDPPHAVNPPGRREIGLPDLLARPVQCPGGFEPPCPELLSAADPGTMSVNYRQEPLALRVRNPTTNGQASGTAGDLSYAFSSNVLRSDTAFNNQPNFYPPLTADLNGRDPYTPLLRAYENDHVQIRILVGAHEEGHNFSVHGIKWLFEPSEPNSGYRNSQMMGISEHFEFIIPQLIKNPTGGFVDRLYSVGSSTDDYWNGIWGLLRAYTGHRQDLQALASNPNGTSGIDPGEVGAYDFSCPKNAVVRPFDVTAVTAQQALPGGRLIYNSRTDGSFGPLFDPTALLYVRTSDLDNSGHLNPGVPIEPLILRARAGECIKLTLRNNLPESPPDVNGFNTLPMIVEGFNNNDLKPSRAVGLHPQLLYYDVSRYDGANVGGNAVQTVLPGHFTTYEWYAGDITINPDGSVTPTPIEFGATNLISSDRIKHASKGAIGALIIEPGNASWDEGGSDCVSPGSPGSRCPATTADVYTRTSPSGPTVFAFREFALLFQDDLNLRTDVELTRRCDVPTGGVVAGLGAPVENLACLEDPEDSGQKALNYRTEPLWKRMQMPPGTPFEETRDRTDWWNVVSNTKVGSITTDPETPVFHATVGQEIRFRILEPGGHSRNHVFALHGHLWDKEPYVEHSTQIGRNGFSFWEGAHMGHGPSNHFDAVIRHGAGGKFSAVGDYLFRDQVAIGFDGGLWGILRVER